MSKFNRNGDEINCAGCEFFESRGTWGKQPGYCHRYPPVRKGREMLGDLGRPTDEHVYVSPDDWCGEFKPA